MISDQIVKFGSSKADASPDHTVRLVTVSASEHTSRGSAATGTSTGPSCDGKLRPATDVLDIRNDLPFYVGMGVARRTGTAHRKNKIS